MKSLSAAHRDLVSDNVGYARALASKHFPAYANTMEYDDLVSSGLEGLCSAAQRFKRKHGAKFTTYAHPRIHGAIVDGARRQRILPRADNIQCDFEFDSHVEAAVHFVSPMPESVDDHFDRARKGDAVRDAMDRLPEHSRQLLELHYYGDLTLEEAGRKLGVSKSWASRMHAKALKALQKEMSRLQAPGSRLQASERAGK
jgi:RNA polymerase sigma factor FliA